MAANSKTGNQQPAVDPPPSGYAPWGKRICRLLTWAKKYAHRNGFTISAVHLMVLPASANDNETVPVTKLICNELQPEDLPALAPFRDATIIERRGHEGYHCRVAKNENGVIEQVFWATDDKYFCWPVRTIINPQPNGRYIFDVFTPPAGRGKGRYRSHLMTWIAQLDRSVERIIVAIDALNNVARQAHQKIGFIEVGRLFCITLVGVKLYRLSQPGANPETQWKVKGPRRQLVVKFQLSPSAGPQITVR